MSAHRLLAPGLGLAGAAAAAAALLAVPAVGDYLALAGIYMTPLRRLGALGGLGLVLVALLVRLAGSAAPAWLHTGATLCAVFGLLAGAAAWAVLDFPRSHASDAYQIALRPTGSLAESAAAMPDRFPGTDALVWLRLHATGTTVAGSEETLEQGGIAAHRLAGVARVDVRLLPADPLLPERLRTSAAETGLLRLNPGSAEPAIWIEAGEGQSPVLCAVPWRRGLLLARAADPRECATR